MPLFLFGQPGFEPRPMYGDPTKPNARDQEQQLKSIGNDLIGFGINKVASKGFEEIIGYLRPLSFLPGEIASTILEPTPLNSGEEDALDALREREEQNREARRVMPGALQIPVEKADP